MNSNTATVQALTAEVCVLMVGSRQVTLSVAKQLDRVVLSDMHPFGRVNLGEPGTVIGRSLKTGALVLSSYDTYRRTPYILEGELKTKIIVCERTLREGSEYLRLSYFDRSILVSRSCADGCGVQSHDSYQVKDRCPHWKTNGADSEISALIADHDRIEAANLRASELPLIVLAGLK